MITKVSFDSLSITRALLARLYDKKHLNRALRLSRRVDRLQAQRWKEADCANDANRA